jgi:crossover junction endodeoxyribonuclease RuvC
MIVLGIDPGTAAVGYGIIERTGGRLRAVDFGRLETRPDDALPRRLLQIHSLVAELIELHSPDIVAVERLFFSRNVQTAMGVGQARGVILLAAAERDIPVAEATPSEVKSAVAGYGAADKEQVGQMVRLVLGLDAAPTPDDAADALATAICIANREREGGGAPGRRSAMFDRAAVPPLDQTGSRYQRAVREALAREKTGRPAGSRTIRGVDRSGPG